MISIKYSRVPYYLREGSFFQVLNAEEEDCELQVPIRCFSHDGQVNSTEDFATLLNVVSFWGLNTIPIGLIQYCINSCVCRLSQLCKLIEADYASIPIAQELRSIFMPATASMVSPYPLVRAIIVNRPEVVSLLAHKVDCWLEATATAAKYGYLGILQLLHRHDHSWDNTVCEKAAAGGHLDCLRYLHDNGCPWDEAACDAAAIWGHIHCLQYLHESGCPWSDDVISHAAKNGSFECMKYAHEHGIEWNDEIAVMLCASGYVDMLKYAIERGCSYDSDSVCWAVLNGHVNCLTYLHDVGCDIDGEVLVEIAIKNGHLNCIEMLIERGYLEPDEYHIKEASYFGQMHIVRYLHETGCPWDRDAALSAARRGHLTVLQYLIEQGCECLDDIICESAKAVGEQGLQCLIYLLERRPVLATSYGELLIAAFTHGNYFAVGYILPRFRHFPELSHTQRAKFRNSLGKDSQDRYDSNMAKCLECALQHNWEANSEAVVFFKSKNPRFPMCQAVLKKWNL